MAQRRLEFEIVDHGVDGSQFFPGCGVFGTPYTDVATGVGESAREAAIDAFDGAGVPTNVDASTLIRELGNLSDDPVAHKACRFDWERRRGTRVEWETWHEGCDLEYFVSLRWRVVETADEVRS